MNTQDWKEKLADLAEKSCNHDKNGGGDCLYFVFEPFIASLLSSHDQDLKKKIRMELLELSMGRPEFLRDNWVLLPSLQLNQEDDKR